MSNSVPKPETVIARAMRVAFKQQRTNLPGVIETYDPARCEASVQVLVQDLDRAENGARFAKRVPVYNHVPVAFLGGGGMRLTFPVKRGDTCVLVFASSSTERWRALGGEVDPQEDHHAGDPLCAIVGLSDFAHAKAAHATATALEGTDVRIGVTGNAVALATKADVDAVNSKLNSLITKFNTHIHVLTTGTASPTAAPETAVAAATGTIHTKAS